MTFFLEYRLRKLYEIIRRGFRTIGKTEMGNTTKWQILIGKKPRKWDVIEGKMERLTLGRGSMLVLLRYDGIVTSADI